MRNKFATSWKMWKSAWLVSILATMMIGGTESITDKRIILQDGYSIHELPPNSGEPLLVNFSVNLRNILGVNEKDQYISLETSLRMYWRDSRVKVDDSLLAADKEYVTLNPKVTDSFWIPDIFLDRARIVRTPTLHLKPASIRVYRDSRIRYSARLNYDVACPMDFHLFPVDEQSCEIKYESFGYTSKELTFAWLESGSTVNPNITLAQFDLSVTLEDTYATDYYDLSYPGIIMKLDLTRLIGYHVTQTYLPSVILVALAWLSLFISPESVPGRVGMSMTTMLTLTAMFGAVRQHVPKVSYITLLDVWMVVCILFVFFCIGEFILVSALLKRGHSDRSEMADKSCRIVIPIMFAVYNAIYWPILLLT